MDSSFVQRAGRGDGDGQKNLVAVAPAGVAAGVLRVEYPFLRYAAVHTDAVAIQLVQHALRSGRSATGRVGRSGHSRGAAAEAARRRGGSPGGGRDADGSARLLERIQREL